MKNNIGKWLAVILVVALAFTSSIGLWNEQPVWATETEEETPKSDTIPPEITKIEEPTEWGAESVAYTFWVTDEGGADEDQVLSYAWVTGDVAAEEIQEAIWNQAAGDKIEVTAEENGTYTFAVCDASGNATVVTVEVDKIDEAAPVISNVEYLNLSFSSTVLNDILGLNTWIGYANAPVPIKVTATDNGSGLDFITLQSGKDTFQIEVAEESEDNVYMFQLPRDAVADVEFREEIHITAVDRAGNETQYQREGADSDILVVENTSPVVSVTYDNNTVVNEKYFTEARTATITVKEHNFADSEINLEGITVSNSNTVGKSDADIQEELRAQLAKTKWKRKTGTDVYTATVEFAEDGAYTFNLLVTDPAGNQNVDAAGETVILYGEKTKAANAFIIDTTVPVVEVSYNNNQVKNDRYFAKARTATITVTERYFTEGTLDLSGITVKRSNASGKTNAEIQETLRNQLAKAKWSRKAGTDTYTASIAFQEDAAYTFDMTCTDVAGNSSKRVIYAQDTQAATQFIVDKTKPVITVTYDNNQVINGKYFTDSRTAVIRIVDHSFSQKTGLTVAVEAYGDAKCKEELAGWKAPGVTFEKVTGETDTYEATIKFNKKTNAYYKFRVSYTDLAGNDGNVKYVDEDGNSAVAPKLFCLDTKKPTGSIRIAKDTKGTSLITTKGTVYEAKPVYVLFEQKDSLSGLDKSKVFYYISTKKLSSLELGIVKWKKAILNDGTTVIPKISAGSSVIVYYKITDKAGNYVYLNTSRIVVDGKRPSGTVTPQVTVNQPVNGIYNGKLTVSLSVTDPAQKDAEGNAVFSGLSEVSYQLVAEGGQKQDAAYAQHVLFTGSTGKVQQSFDGDITIQATHDVTLWVRVIDNAGSVVEKSCQLKIDTTAPQITVAYDNNSATDNKLFKNKRTATITVKERNFSKQQFTIQITKDGAAYNQTLNWETSGSGDDTLHQAVIHFNGDGDYVISGITCTDDAGNKTTTYTQVQQTVAAESFTIDQTVPVIAEITFDNNAVENGNYYQQERTATITITEHNFDANLVKVTVNATGDAKETPSVTAFTANGDIHTATVHFTEDGVYGILVEVTDEAGNEAVSQKAADFVIDKTKGEITISGVKNKSANREKNIPITVSVADTNAEEMKIQLASVTSGKKVVDEKVNTVSFALDSFTDGKGDDDVYVLTVTCKDKAGNEGTKKIQFSVNRTGSTYSVEYSQDAIAEGIYKEAPQVIITEKNVDQVQMEDTVIRVSILGGDNWTLKSNQDFDVEIDEGENQVNTYTYTIKPDAFTKEGVYTIEVLSIDATGRANQSGTSETQMTFKLDQTGPNLTVKNIKESTVYQEENHNIQVSASDMNLKELRITAENMEQVYTSEELEKLEDENGEIEVTISGSTKTQTITVTAVDKAGNETTKTFAEVLITTSVWAQFFNNTGLVIGSIFGLLILIGAVILVITLHKSKAS